MSSVSRYKNISEISFSYDVLSFELTTSAKVIFTTLTSIHSDIESVYIFQQKLLGKQFYDIENNETVTVCYIDIDNYNFTSIEKGKRGKPISQIVAWALPEGLFDTDDYPINLSDVTHNENLREKVCVPYCATDFNLEYETIPHEGIFMKPDLPPSSSSSSSSSFSLSEKKRKLPVLYDCNKLQDYLKRFPTYKDFEVSDWLARQLIGSINSMSVDILNLIRKEIDYAKWSVHKVCNDLGKGFGFGSELLSKKISQFTKNNKSQSLDTIAKVLLDTIFFPL